MTETIRAGDDYEVDQLNFEVVPERYNLTLGYDIIFDGGGHPKVLELNGWKSGLLGTYDISRVELDTVNKRLKNIIDRCRGSKGYFDHEIWQRAVQEAGLEIDGVHNDYYKLKKSIEFSLKLIAEAVFLDYPDALTKEKKDALRKYAYAYSSLVKPVDEVEHHNHRNAPYPHSPLDYIVGDKSFLRFLVDSRYRPREFDEFEDNEIESVSHWVVKSNNGSLGSEVNIIENNESNRQSINDMLKNEGRMFLSIQEFIAARPSEMAINMGKQGVAAARYVQDIAVRSNGSFEVTYAGGYQRVGSGMPLEDFQDKIVNRSRGASSHALSESELERIKSVTDKITRGIVDKFSWLRNELKK